MCLFFCAFEVHPQYRLIIAANRDEFYERPSRPAAFWPEAPELLAGKDLQGGGTWFGVTRSGRIAAVTNYRDPRSHRDDAPSRGLLLTDYLLGQTDPAGYLEQVRRKGAAYNGFNLIVGTTRELYYYSNRKGGVIALTPGLYGLSNHLLDTPWPKVARGKEALGGLLSRGEDPAPEALFDILSDRTIAEDRLLPDTGVGLDWERILSARFITSPVYGTRSSTLLYVDRQDRVTFIERNFNAKPGPPGTARFEFALSLSDADRG
ncbi:MAG: NRDE family protein [Syntrophobacterales bacterium]|nr:NRDE family protein [Syntrophobacterales bacterium]